MGTTDPIQGGPESCRLRGAFFTPSIFNDFRERGDFFDVNLFTDDGALQAHKVILSACSDFFREKLRKMQPVWTFENPGVAGTVPVMAAIYMTGVTHADLESILDFIYTGDVQMSVDRLDDFLVTAQRLKVKGLLSEDQFVREQTLEQDFSPKTTTSMRAAPEPKRARLEKRPARGTRKTSRLETLEEAGRSEKVKVESAPDAMKMAEAVASMEVVEASGSNEADVDVRFDLADWKLEMGENDNDDQSEVLIDGQKVQSFIKKVDALYHCQLCDHTAKDKSNLVRHLKRRHTSPTHELCPHCGKTYKNKECLYNHMSSKRCLRGAAFDPRNPKILGYLRFDAEDKRWVCVECGNRYRQKVYAREHVVYKHIGADQVGDEQDSTIVEDPSVSKLMEFLPSQNKWKCLACAKIFTSSFNVAHHIQLKHRRDDDDIVASDDEESGEEEILKDC